MRTIKELLKVMLQHQDFFAGGMCTWIIDLRHGDLINWDEYNLLSKFIKKHRNTPTLSLKDWWYKKPKYSGYFWEFGKITPRIHWIEYQIKQLK